jgi:hypothetical protein
LEGKLVVRALSLSLSLSPQGGERGRGGKAKMGSFSEFCLWKLCPVVYNRSNFWICSKKIRFIVVNRRRFDFPSPSNFKQTKKKKKFLD